MYSIVSAELQRQREARVAAKADRIAAHLRAARAACRPARGLLGKAGLCRSLST